MSIDKELSPFLRELADNIDNDELSQHQLQKIGEFYMAWKLMDQMNDDNQDSEFHEIDLMKFVILGWFIYKHIVKNDPNL